MKIYPTTSALDATTLSNLQSVTNATLQSAKDAWVQDDSSTALAQLILAVSFLATRVRELERLNGEMKKE